ARLYLNGTGAPHDPRTAARWFGLSAQKGQCEAQAMLGAMLFEGDHVPRQAARGLMWLARAKDSARADQAWITKLYDSAMKQASEDERALAAVYLRRWLETRREETPAPFNIQIDVNRDMVGWLVPAAHVPVDACAGQPVGGLRREQNVVDAD